MGAIATMKVKGERHCAAGGESSREPSVEESQKLLPEEWLTNIPLYAMNAIMDIV
jgi:hypothetical protein